MKEKRKERKKENQLDTAKWTPNKLLHINFSPWTTQRQHMARWTQQRAVGSLRSLLSGDARERVANNCSMTHLAIIKTVLEDDTSSPQQSWCRLILDQDTNRLPSRNHFNRR